MVKKEVIIKDGLVCVVREALEEDAENIIKYINTVAGESDNITFGPGEFNITLDEEKNLINRINEIENCIMLVATINNEIVSVSNFNGGKRPRNYHVGSLGISVIKKYWNKGVGTAVLKTMIDWAKIKGIKKINLSVRTDNKSATHLYEKVGFVKEGKTTRGMYINNEFIDLYNMGIEVE